MIHERKKSTVRKLQSVAKANEAKADSLSTKTRDK